MWSPTRQMNICYARLQSYAALYESCGTRTGFFNASAGWCAVIGLLTRPTEYRPDRVPAMQEPLFPAIMLHCIL